MNIIQLKRFVRWVLVMLVGLVIGLGLFAQTTNNNAQLSLVPLPARYSPNSEIFVLQPSTTIIAADTALNGCASLLQFYTKSVAGWQPLIAGTTGIKNSIHLKIDSNLVHEAEGYHLQIKSDVIELVGHNTAGIIYGIQTIRQLWVINSKKQLVVTGCSIEDHPRFAYRGMALDVSRHLFPVSFIKKYIDLLSLYKFNTFHWHLTDDQGWRIEIKKYPALQSVDAWRDETLIGHKKELPHVFDGKRYGGFYTQLEIADIIAYASKRNITIIPEIEMPGHALAALSAYPSLGCTGGPYKAATFWGVFDDVYCAGNDSTFTFLENVLDEVMQLFRSAFVHIGGDECPKTKWQTCPKCQRRIKELQLKDEHALQNYFITRIEKYVNSKGKNIIGWDEILEGGLAPNATVMSWRGEEGGIAAARQQHQVIMTPESNLYFDYYQSLHPSEPLAACCYTPLEKVYSYEPAGAHTSESVQQYIKGIEAQTWSEYLVSNAQAEYMIFPRALAVAEIGWTSKDLRNYAGFAERVRQQQVLLKKLQVNTATNFDEIQYSASVLQKEITVTLVSSLPNSQILYTTDGTAPFIKSKKYTGTIRTSKSCVIKAGLFDAVGKQKGRVWQQAFNINKATGMPVTLQNAPTDKYAPGTSALVNGINGNTRYNDNQWIGFSGNDLDAIIDLQTATRVSSVQIHFLNYHWQRMWAPVSLEISVSTDGIDYSSVYTGSKFPLNGINTVMARFAARNARYIKLHAVNKGTIPAKEYGAGGKALLMIDEIMVE